MRVVRQVILGLACLSADGLSAADFFAIDAGASCNGRGGLVKCPRPDGDKFKYVVDAIAANGFGWARERLFWPSFNPSRGVFVNLDRFVADNRYYEQKGVRPSWIFHKPPAWTEPRRNMPGDLGALYAFVRRLAASVAPFPADWEIWNEPDLGHYPETAWDFAAAVKTGYLAVKSANPAATVLMGALCSERRNAFDETAFANDLGDYTDAVNFHLYFGLPKYPQVLGGLRDFLSARGLGERAVFVTEAGIRHEGDAACPTDDPLVRAHSPEQELHQAEFIVKALVLMRHEGVARAFPFYLSPYNEQNGRKDWGYLRRDGTAKPGLEWMREMIAALGEATMVGELKRPAEGVRAFLFAEGARQTVVYWLETQTDRAIAPFDVTKIGNPERTFVLQLPNGEARTLTARRRPGYETHLAGLTAAVPARRSGRLGVPAAAKGVDRSLVVQATPSEEDFRIVETKSALEPRGTDGRVTLTVWNFSERQKTVTLQVEGGTFETSVRRAIAPAGGKAEFAGRLRPHQAERLMREVTVRACGEAGVSTRLVLPILDFTAFRRRCEVQELAWRCPSDWTEHTSATRHALVYDEAEQAIRVDLGWNREADHWCYPTLKALPEEICEAEFLEFEIRTDCPDQKYGAVLVQVDRVDGTRNEYLSFEAPTTRWERRYVRLGGLKKPAVSKIAVGMNPLGDVHRYWLRNLRLLKAKPKTSWGQALVEEISRFAWRKVRCEIFAMDS